ncbi:hypothetical protein SUGI_1146470 [Cryptomeria japonica]|uniref:uncharacterized protein LOC131069707 isoform X2 n=1 Tax=Cryptomeria japonica TaxID=3369 RepID=UPI002414C0BC|nr:uncharacterized protein LOC131069707 isoform X2 [Cryptomeria japonica]GLJ53728.1 hypothetical protein SUGI_1146470 [Cryptomeria japonica]
MASSSSSSVTPTQLIDQILNTKADKPDSEDLRRLVQQIDDLLARYDAQLQKKNPIGGKLADLPSASEASSFGEQVSTNVKQIANEIKEYSGDKHQTTIAILNAIGNVHWIAVGFLVVGATFEIVDTIKANKEECLRLFKSMIDLSKIILQLQVLSGLQKELHDKLNESIQLIVKGAILCCSQKKRTGFKRVFKASRDRQELQQLWSAMDRMREMLHIQISTSIYQSMQSPPTLIPTLDNDAVGIEGKIKEVIQLLNWQSNNGTSAVVIYGIGGSGKTTLGDAVFSSLKDKLQGWKYSKVTLIQNLEKNPEVSKIQSLILEDLTATKHDVRDFQSGRQILKDIIEKEPVFLYVDNALYLEPLRNLLPKDFTNAKKFRLLLTARETNVSGVIDSCGIEPCELYEVGSLPIDAAIQVLCKQIDRKRDKESVLQDRPQIKKIAEKCNCCPLFLEVIGAYLHQRKNRIESYEKVLRWLEPGDEFGGTKKYNFDESRVLFSYNELEPSAKEAFLDICSIFSSWHWHWQWDSVWDWEEVACIVGEEEMVCLEEGALIKRESDKIKIHDLILAAGHNKSKNNRFKNIKDFSLALKNKELFSQVKGVCIEGIKSPLHISAEELDAMSRSLRIFYLGYRAMNLTSFKGKCSKQFDELRCLCVERGVSNLPMNIFNLKNLRYLSISKLEEDIILSPSMNLPNLNVLKLNGSRIDGISEIVHLRSLKRLELVECNAHGISEFFPNLTDLQRLTLSKCRDLTELPESLVRLRFLQKLDLSFCINLKQLPAGFGELTNLTKLNLSGCHKLTELPESLVRLRSLQKLDLRSCGELKQLPAGFGELVNLTELDLSFCWSLQELPRDLEKLTSLHSLNVEYCSSLLCLPAELGNSKSLTFLQINGCESLTCLPHGLMSVWKSEINFEDCSSLIEIPEEICKQTMLTNISLSRCTRLKMLPSRLGELTCLENLDLKGCESLQELCNDFHCLGRLKYLTLDGCKSLSSLPLEFGKLSSLETLVLSECEKLEELCSDFHCLVALRDLKMSKCDSLRNLPDRFGELGCLEKLDLSGCSNLVKLSDDFHLLPSLTSLDLSKCESLGGEWMDSVGNVKSLWCLDIVCSEKLILRWMQMKSQKERNLVVVTDFQGRDKKALLLEAKALLLEAVLSKVFDEEGLLVDEAERPFHSSSLQPQTQLILIIDEEYHYSWKWEALGKSLQQLQCNSKELQIIYVGTHFKTIRSESAVIRFLAYTPDITRTSSFCHKLFALSRTYGGIAVFRSTDQLEGNSLRCLSAWEDISDELALLANTPRESNVELLKELLVTEETDYLLLNGNHEVKVSALQGKLILLLVTYLDETLEVHTSAAVKEMYLKMQESHDYTVELVWVPIPNHKLSWEDFERAAANAPWPVVPNPWLIEQRRWSFFGKESLNLPFVCVVDQKGRIIKKDAMAMIERSGVQAYPFSPAREEELRKAEWEGFKANSLSTLQFVFQNLELLSNKVKEMVDRGVMMLFCVGSPEKMMELAPRLNSAFTMLEMDFQLFYVAHSQICGKDYDVAYQKLKENESEMCGITTLTMSDLYRLWRRVKHLQNELMNGMGTDERIVKVRRMVLGLASAEHERWMMRIVLVDGRGEMVSGRGMELVEELMCDGEEESKEKLVEEIKKGGVEKSVESRWRDGIIHPKHHPQHPLLKLEDGIKCSLCGGDGTWEYQCNVCEKYVLCWLCKLEQ